MLKSADGWWATFVTLTMRRRKMEIVRERQRRPIATATQDPMSDLATPSLCLPLATQQQKMIHACLPERRLVAINTQT